MSKGVMSGLGRAMVTLCSRLALARASRILGFSRDVYKRQGVVCPINGVLHLFT